MALAELLRNRLRDSDIIARIGGEEFSILLPDTDLESAFDLADEIRKTIADTPVRYEDRDIYYTVSIGVAAYHQAITAVDDLFREADRALYQAKDNGRNLTVASV